MDEMRLLVITVANGTDSCCVPHEFYGLSKDKKPVGYVEGAKVTNGSLFLEIDTKKLFMFDEENQIWIEQ